MHTGPRRTAKDYFETWIMGTILGGGFSSRINMNIREKNGYAYGARGGFSYHRTGSTFSAGGAIRNDATREAIGEIVKEIEALRGAPPKDEEMTREKDGAILGLPAQWATGQSILSTFQTLVYHGLPLDWYETFIPSVKGVTKERVHKAARRHLRPDRAQILVVGDAKTVLPEVEELKKPVVRLDADGKAVPQPKP
jgi:predicted Zn-dependent peptidase